MSIEVSPTAKTLSPHPAQEFNHEYRNPPLSAHDTPHSMTQISNRSSTSGGQSVLTPPAESSQAPGSGRPDRLIGRTPTQRDKDERIRVRRREATLKRKAETVARCECRSECQCRNGSVRSNAASCGPGDSDRNIQVPDHVLRNLLIDGSGSSASRSSSGVATGSGLAGVGVHFEDEHHDMDDPTNGRLGARQSFDDRLSQASTAYVRSNGSSISLVSRRPSTLRRSNTAPGLSARRPPHVFRPGVSEALQNRYIPDQVHGTAAGPGSSTNGESDAGEVSTMALDGGAEVPDDVGTGEG
ncbi:MAG: hypothetical protein LQ338_005510 [Usnochroma carphineum]|nr:MAG: hypothetical protein LQ338_005510 [Usnochroma carphineum]